MINEPIIMKKKLSKQSAFQLRRLTEERHLLKENPRALEPLLPRTNDASHPKQKRKQHLLSTQTTNQMKLVHIHSQSVRPFLH